jgi:hypothetical protein
LRVEAIKFSVKEMTNRGKRTTHVAACIFKWGKIESGTSLPHFPHIKNALYVFRHCPTIFRKELGEWEFLRLLLHLPSLQMRGLNLSTDNSRTYHGAFNGSL